MLKLKLETEFGMSKMDSPPDDKLNNEWLNYVYNFEKQYAENRQIKVYDFINRPEFKKADELSKEQISVELNRLMEIMNSNFVELNTLCDYDDEVIYRFITGEFFELEMGDMRIPGMMHCFTYEDFHQNHEHDIREHADDFLELLISKKWDDYMNNILLAQTISYKDVLYDKKTFPEIIEAFQSDHQKMKLLKWEIHSVSFDLESKTGSLEGSIEYKSMTSAKIFQGTVNLEFILEFDFWSVSKVIIPGFSK